MKAKRILASVVACLVLMMGMTVMASAEGTATELPAAVGGVITLTEDVTLANPVVIDETVTIDGKGFTLTYTGTNRAITVENTAVADLTIKDLTVVCSANACQRGINYNTTGKLTLDNVSVSGKKVTYGVNIPSSAVGAQVNITDSDIAANIAINVWGANAVINVTDTDLTSVDTSASENYAAIILNKDASSAAEGAVVTVTGGSITALDEMGAVSAATSNDTVTGAITISNTTTVIGTAETMVAIVDYGKTSTYSFEELPAAIARAAEDGATVRLLRDVELTEKIVIDKAVVIDGQDHKITTSAEKLFEVFADFEVYDLKMESTHKKGRCVDTRVDGITVSIDNCELTAEGSGLTQPLTIGGTAEGGLTVNITGSKITSNKYTAIIMFVPAELTIENSELFGYGTIYAKGINGNTSGSDITVTGSKLTAKNTYSGISNSFAAIVVEDEGVEVTVDATSTIEVEATSDAIQAAISLSNKDSEATIECPVEAKGENAVVVINVDNASLTVTDENVIAAVKDAGYNVAADGKVSVPEARWVEDTDAGFYLDGETKLGLLRFLFAVDINEEITASGIKYISPSAYVESGKDATNSYSVEGGKNSVFYGDINGIPEEAEGKSCIAIAYITTESGKTYWSDAIEGVVDMTSQQFTEYVAGGAQ